MNASPPHPSTPPTARILVVDDHTLFRRGLMALLARDRSLDVVGEAADAGEALRLAQSLQPDVILLDNHLPGVTGIGALPALRQAAPAARILMLTVSEDGDDLAAALRAGACGYLLKTIDGDALVTAIHRARGGENVVAHEMTSKLVTAFRDTRTAPAPSPVDGPDTTGIGGRPSIGLLSPRERDVLRAIARGASNKEIARDLGIAETTVKIHVQHLLRKLDLSSRVQAAVFATARGLD
jgi:two-component system, NarL family, nitrate/nitrite response regulator NarL